MKIDSRRRWHSKPPTLILLAAFGAMLPTAPTAATVDGTAITVRVYRTAALSSALEQRALAEAKALLGTAGVDVSWRRCAGGQAAACPPTLGPSELLVRMIRTSASWEGVSATLGEAHVDHQTGGGVLATVHVDRVVRLASEAGTDPGVLLGRVTAHELGHLLMGEGHSFIGLMRAGWTLAEIRQNRDFDWRFTAADVAAMRGPGRDIRN
ncbi:MAG TPA: hypothetical protein VFO58_05855 [Vicinamibacterales bacterium]|nr:hypothetical protein [Vicinamibacterales bacterium]